jgi:polyvinyl alcohol dehydrogenase (cytochrome)
MKQLLILALGARGLCAQDGAAVYASHCAQCHDHPVGRMPAANALRAMARESILTALNNGSMKAQASALSEPQRRAVAEYLAASGPARAANTCTTEPRMIADTPLWAAWGVDQQNTRFQSATEAGLEVGDVPSLQLKWAFDLGKGTTPRSQPAVAFGKVFVGAERDLYALNAQSGCTDWVFKADEPVRTGIVINPERRMILFGAHSTLYAVNSDTGS